jgi:hypothetical protein
MKELDKDELLERIEHLQQKAQRLPAWAKPPAPHQDMEFFTWLKGRGIHEQREWQGRIAKHQADIGRLIRYMGAAYLDMKARVGRLH